ncbi:MAG: aminotransferase class I/II-fold pyridoxal phosphate-dependent enzyme, partial [Planctomycetes bacterium]|nr:aminotransferase class I/II-fold pyridoxal phosphate-dependent enzyme [Planctomycetota bacterium]
DGAGYRLRHGVDPLDFSASLGPLGVPDGVRAALHAAIDDIAPYPDPRCRALTDDIAMMHRVPAEKILVANGAADAIFRLVDALRPRCVLMPVPAFSEYGQALRVAGAEVREHILRREDGFRLQPDFHERITPDIDAVFLCQPNNPVGEVIDPELLRNIFDKTESLGLTLVVDECFCDLLDDPANHSLLAHMNLARHLYVLRSFTKLYSIAGLRLGYCIGADPAVIEAMRGVGQPWAVSTLAQAAGRAAIREEEFVRDTRKVVREERAWLIDSLNRLGLEIHGSRANYVFFAAPVDDLAVRIENDGILIRDCRNFAGLRAGYYRVAVRLRHENERLVAALAKALSASGRDAPLPVNAEVTAASTKGDSQNG